MADIIHRVGIRAPIAQVYAAVSTIEGIAGWWSRETSGSAQPGGSVVVGFSTPSGEVLGRMQFEVAEAVPVEWVRWSVQEGPPDWPGTDITFRLAQEGEFTILLFGHRNWSEANEGMAHCSMKWATFLLSLRQYAETGSGRPSPDDLKIDNWN